MTALIWVGVVVGGGLGATLRFIIDGAVAKRVNASFPLGTMVVNLSGAVVLGFLAGLALPHDVSLMVGTGVVGSYTTFSTWMLETQRLAEERQALSATVNVVAAVILGFAAALAGRALATLL